ncbi:MAG: hypothetical protein Q9163_004460 [Psora crenata]
MPSRNPSICSANNDIDKLDFDAHRQRPGSSHGSHHSNHPSLLASDQSFFSIVVEGTISRDRREMARRMTKYSSLGCAILSCLCAGSITAYSLYGPLFLSHLEYSQYEVNALSTTAELAMYLPIPLFGWLCDRYNPRPLSLAAAIFFGLGYLLAALAYQAGPRSDMINKSGYAGEASNSNDRNGWPFAVMVLAFVGVGAGTSCQYISAVTTCAKNFGRGKRKGLALAMPIAAFGLSGLWQSQVGTHFFKEKNGNGNLDVFRYFLFLAGLLFTVGLIGSVGLRVVDEEEMIDEAVDELERSGMLDDNPLIHPTILHESEACLPNGHTDGYGTINRDNYVTSKARSFEDTSAIKKALLLDHSTRVFLTDPTMWFLALGFFLTSGPGETFINNVGTLLDTLYPPPSRGPPPSNSPATHVSIIALTSTLARLATGTLSDLLAPTTTTTNNNPTEPNRKCTLSRLWWLLTATALFSVAQLLLATSVPATYPGILPLVSALVGLGYGAIFSLTPIVVSVVWGVENFGTNWGIVVVVPAGGAALWGAVYSVVYQSGIREDIVDGTPGAEGQCYGGRCYRGTFLAMAVASWVAMLLWVLAWRGWRRRGVAV